VRFIDSIYCFVNDFNNISKVIYQTSHRQILSEDLVLAVISAEDRYFLDHQGVSFKSIIRALIKKHGGASTINMQLVRVLTQRYEVSMKRKIREAIMSLLIDFKFSKVDILQAYLCHSYFGVGMIGITSVLNDFFAGKGISDLKFLECCFIASMLKRPAPKEISIDWALRINNRICHIQRIIYINEGNMRSKIKLYLQKDK